MTNEEAIEILQSGAGIWPITDRANNALNKAIKALEQEPCEDAISRQYLRKQFQEKCVGECSCCEWDSPYWCGLIDNAPSVKPQEPRTGHWVEENINEWSRKVFCSECGCTPPFEHISNGDIYSAGGYGVNNKTKFCPNCGARMEEQE